MGGYELVQYVLDRGKVTELRYEKIKVCGVVISVQNLHFERSGKLMKSVGKNMEKRLV